MDTRKFSFRLGHAPGKRIVRVAVYVDGKLRNSRRGRSLTRIAVKALPKGTFRVKIISTQNNGQRRVSTRTYRGCTKSRPRTQAVSPGAPVPRA